MIDCNKYQVKQMNIEEAEQIVRWRYKEPYSIYNMDESDECLAELLNGSYHSFFDSRDKLVGFFCFGKSAQVPAGNAYGVYSDIL